MGREKFGLGDVLIYLILGILCLTIVFSFVHLFSISFSPSYIATKGGLLLYPKDLTFDNYAKVVKNHYIWQGYKNTLIRTILGTAAQLFITSMGAYVLSKKFFPHRNFWTFFIVFTMFFSGGLIPSFLVVKSLGLLDTYASMIIPGLVSAYNLTIMRNYFQSLPEEIEESCMIDGAGRFRIFWQFVLPLSTPILATLTLFYAVGRWNAYADAKYYITSKSLQPIQYLLSNMILSTSDAISLSEGSMATTTPEVQEAAMTMFATIPILVVYPFVQKYFVKGTMIGAIKG